MNALRHGLKIAAILLPGLLQGTPVIAAPDSGCDCQCSAYSELISQIDSKPSASIAQVDQCGAACAIAWGRCEAAWSIGRSALPPALAGLIDDFLSGLATSDPVTMERFWDDGMVFTGPRGQRLGKSDMIRDPLHAELPAATADGLHQSAVDLVLQDFGATAVVTFRLVTRQGDRAISEYLNTGVFRQTDQSWRAVAWQTSRSSTD